MCGSNIVPSDDLQFAETVNTFFEQLAPEPPAEVPSWHGVDLAEELRNAADKVEELTRERDEAQDEVARLEAQIRELEEDQPDLERISSLIEDAYSAVSTAADAAATVEGKVSDLRYTDLEDVMDEVDRISSFASDAESDARNAHDYIVDARNELERI